MFKLIKILLSAKLSNFNFSIYKTLVFNYHYFEFNVFKELPVFISKNAILKSLKGSCKIECDIVHSGFIKFGFGEISIFDEKFEKSIWHVEPEGEVIFNQHASFGIGSRISVWKNAKLQFGNNFKINAKTTIVCTKEIIFEDDCLLSWNIEIIDTDFHRILDKDGFQTNQNKSIKIGSKNWICSGCKILKGTITNSNTIIGANSVVSSQFLDSDIVIVGSPGRIVKKDINWQL